MADAGSVFWSLTPDEAYAAVASRPEGLTEAEAAERLAHRGPQRGARGAGTGALLARQFTSPIVLILIGATVLSGLLGDLVDAAIILVIITASGLLGFWQERGASIAMAQLLGVVRVDADVRRAGVVRGVAMTEVVPGDVVELNAGDLVPGDCRVLTARSLQVDESALTGETFPVEKRPEAVAAGAVLQDRRGAVFLGTHVVSGTGEVLVVHTDRSTELGAVAEHLDERPTRTGFERGMTAFGLLLARVMAVLVVLVLVVNLLLHRSLVESALFSLALAVGLTPQLLPAITSLSLAEGARALARHRVIVRRLDAIEDFGSMTVLCSDKTGTMTSGTVTLVAAVALDGSPDDQVQHLAHLNATLQTGMSNPIDDAVAAAGDPLPAQVELLGEVPYDFDRRRLSVLVREQGRDMLVCKGAVSSVLAACDRARTGQGDVPLASVRADVEARVAALAGQGLRVLALAVRERPAVPEAPAVSDEQGLVLLGLLTLADPPKADAPATLARAADLGISVRMVTGDSRLVAAHVAGQVGLDAATMLTGEQVAALDDAALAAAAEHVVVFAEIDPLGKERVVRALRRGGPGGPQTVGYLGDGINDAPALHAADVGISVDSAVDVAKSAAAIVLLDKDLGVLLDGVRQGRRTFANTLKYIVITCSANVGNMISMAVAAAVLPFLPMLAGQILLVNLLTDLPSTAIAGDAVDPDQLASPQRWDVRAVRNAMLVFGSVSSAFDLVTFGVLRWGFHAQAPEFRSAWFLGSVLTEVAVLFVLRTHGPLRRSRPSRALVVLSVVVALVTLTIPYGPVAGVLEMVPVPGRLLGALLVLLVAYVVTTEVVKRQFYGTNGNLRDTSGAYARARGRGGAGSDG